MANTKVTQHVIANNAITADQLATAAVTAGKLHATLDLSNKTLTLPAVAVATTQSASDNTTKVATTAYVTTAIANLNDSAPAALNTLNEIAAALGDDANYASTTTAAIAAKLPLAGGTLTGNLVLSGAPSSGLHPATKTYTDTADALKLNLSGGTLTGDLILNTTTALKIPVGTTGQRPSAATGQIRWNTSDGALEVYNGSAWVAVGTGTSNKVLDTFTGNGSNRTFALTVTPANEDAIMVFIDGAYQEKGDYVLTNASLVLDTAPLANEKIAVHTTTASVHDGTSALNNQFTATANQTAFTLSQDPKSENNTQVYINGVYQQKTDYTVVGTTLTFDTGLTVGDVVEVNMFTVSTLGNTDTVSEGVSNLYHTAARARGAISVTGNAISYNSSTGVLSSNFEEGPTFTGNVNITGDLDVGAADGNNAVMKLSANTGNWVFTNVQSSRKLEISDSDGTGTVLTIDTSGNVGIGETSPDARLDIRSSGASTYPLLIKSSDDQQLFRFREESDTRGTFYINDASENSKVTLASVGSSSFMGGNLGIGTTAPDSKLEVVTNSTSIDYTLRLKNTNTTDDNGTAVLFQGKDTSGNDVSYGALKFKYTNHVTEKSQFELWHMNNSGVPTQAMTLNHDGYFGFGTATPKKKVHIEHTAGASEGILISGASDTNGHTAGILLRAEGGEADSALRAKGGIFFERFGTYGVGKLHIANRPNADNNSAAVADADITINDDKVGIGTRDPRAKLHVATGSLMVTPIDSAHNGAYHIIGSVSNYNTANGRYIHAQLSTAQNNMFHIVMEGYTYTTGQRSGRCSGYVYNYGSGGNGATGSFGGPGVYDGRVSGNIVAMFSNSNNARIEVVIDTGNTGTGNRWGSYTLVGGDDHISSYAAIEVVQYTTSSNAARQYTS